MAQSKGYRVEVEYIKNNNIEAEVPSSQDLRDASNYKDDTTDESNVLAVEQSTQNEDDTVEILTEDGTFVPVMTVTKNEATYTKGDVKLHKVSISENISDTEADTHSVTAANDSITNDEDIMADRNDAINREDNEEKKSKTRIPIFKLKQTVEKLKKRRDSNDEKGANNKDDSSLKPTPRTSIPRLKKESKIQPPSIVKKDTRTQGIKDATSPSDEFDKIFNEIAKDVPMDVSLEGSIISSIIADPDKVETKFEEIIHDYVENKVQPIDVEKVKRSKIPLFKRNSEQDIKVPKLSDRRLSLKNTQCTDSKVKNKTVITKVVTRNDEDLSKESEILTESIIQKEDPAHEISSDRTNVPKPETDYPEKINDNNQPKETVKVVTPVFETTQLITDNIHIENDGKLTNEAIVNTDDSIRIVSQKESDFQQTTLENNTLDTNKELTKAENTPSYRESVIVVHENMEKTGEYRENEINAEYEQIEIISTSTNEGTTQNILDESNIHIKSIEDNETELVQNQFNNIKQNYARDIDSGPVSLINVDYNDYKDETVNDEMKTEPEITNEKQLNKDHDNISNIEFTEQATQNEQLNREIIHINNAEKGERRVEMEAKDIETINDPKSITYDNFNESLIENDTLQSTNESDNKLSKKKSVLSKIAMFEAHQSNGAQTYKPPRHWSKISKPKDDDGEKSIDNKHRPKIVEEVLKTSPTLRKLNSNSNKDKDDIVDTDTSIIIENQVIEEIPKVIEEHVIIPGDVKEINVVYEKIHYSPEIENQTRVENNNDLNIMINPINNTINTSVTDSSNNGFVDDFAKEKTASISDFKEVDPKFNDDRTDHIKVDENEVFHRRKPGSSIVESKLRRLKSINDPSTIKRSKSLAELDLGDAIKGRVHEMIHRMKSVEKLNIERRDVIGVKERPRNKSVSEKIALFEGKLTPIGAQSTKSNVVSIRSVKKNETHAEVRISDEEYQERIEELANAPITYGRITNMTYMVLRDGNEIPILTLGTALMDPKLIGPIISAAINLGYRAIDTAYIYGNEREVGEAIRAKIEDGTVRREDLYIINKLWSTFHRSDLVDGACRASLSAMGLDYFDLYLIHNPMSFKEGVDPIPKIANVIQYSEHDYLDAWYGMENLVINGLARSIGVSNFNSEQIARVVDKGKIKPVVNMVECHPYLNQRRLQAFCDTRKVKLFCFGVLGSKGTPAEFKSGLQPVIDDPLVQVLAAGLNMSPAQLLIRYQIDGDNAVVVKASNAKHLWQNLQALELQPLEEAHINALDELNKNKRTFTFAGLGDTHRNYPFRTNL